MDARPETIAAIASAPGRSHTGIVRIAGVDTLHALDALLASPCPRGAGAHRVALRLGVHALPALLLLSRAPRSYTGDDAAELLLPGNPPLLGRVLDALLATGLAVAAWPGAFSERAFEGGKLTLTQAEGVAATIAAETASQLEGARRLLTGELGERARGWGTGLARLLALVEAGIDFTDQEDVVAIAPGALSAGVRAIADDLDAFLGGAPARAADAERPVVMLVGAPSAGKSTLFNALLARRRAAVAQAPGTTRDALAEPLDLASAAPGAGVVELVDLAGLDDGQRTGSVDAAAQALAREHLRRADVLVHCDPAGVFTLANLPSTPTIRARTKADRAPRPRDPDRADMLDVCALDGTGLGALRSAIARAAFDAPRGEGAVLPRHRASASTASRALTDALELIDADARTLGDPELVAGSLRSALDALSDLAGEHTPDDVIGRVFASFCVGK
ncbi:MAG: GTPase [Planctomycetota bacterium]